MIPMPNQKSFFPEGENREEIKNINELNNKVDKLIKYFNLLQEWKGRMDKILENNRMDTDRENNKEMLSKIKRKYANRNSFILEINRKQTEEIRSLDRKVAGLKGKKNELRKIQKEEINQLNGVIKQYWEKIDKLEEKISKRDKKIIELQESFQKQEDYIEDLRKRLSKGKEDLERATTGYINKQNELEGIYRSTGFKYLLRPLWCIIGSTKRFIRKSMYKFIFLIKRIIYFILHPYNIYPFQRLKELRAFLRYFIAKHTVKDKWAKRYLSHILNGTFSPPPRYLTLMLTSRCNLKCKFCNITENKYSKTDIPIDKTFKIIDSAIRLGVEEIEFTGGEPFLHPHLWEIIQYANDKGAKTHIVTNGILVAEQIDKIRKVKLNTISISIDGKETTYEKLRNVSGGYNRVMEGIELLKQSGKNVAVNFVIMDKNIYDLEYIYNQFLAQNIEVYFWPVNGRKDLYINDPKKIRIYRKFIKNLREKGQISNSSYKYLNNGIYYFKGKKIFTRCLGLAYKIAVDVEGDILPCCVWQVKNLKLGNIFKEDLDVIFYSKKAYQVRKRIFNNGCSYCYNSALAEFHMMTGLNFLVNSKIK